VILISEQEIPFIDAGAHAWGSFNGHNGNVCLKYTLSPHDGINLSGMYLTYIAARAS